MDTLSDLLQVVRLSGAFFYATDAAEPWRVETVAARELRPRILPGVEHVISYHIVIAGECYAALTDGEPVHLVAGDAIVFPHGDAHVMSSARGMAVTAAITSVPARYAETVILGDRDKAAVSLVCGFLGCDRRPFNPLLAALPRQMHLRGITSAWGSAFTRQLTEERRFAKPGADTIVTRLAELMFIEALRRFVADLPPGGTGWLAGLRDEMVGQVLALLHARPAHPWTIDTLARAVASSRSNVAKRFTEMVGQPPMQYLAQWRMQIAANLLVRTGAKVATIGAEVGYDSEAAFSRAFKKATRVSPGAWRRSSWRYPRSS